MQETVIAEPMMGNSRIIVQKGNKSVLLKLDDVAFFYTESKIVYTVDKNNTKYLSTKNLTELESSLNEKIFFRANRQYIVNLNYIRSFQSIQRVKILIDLEIGGTKYEITVSQVTVPEFKKWITGL